MMDTNEHTTPETTTEEGGRLERLVMRLRAHIAQMAPHQTRRQQGELLVDAMELAEAVVDHNRQCVCNDSPVNDGGCGYAPYSPRRCPDCPAQWRIDLEA